MTGETVIGVFVPDRLNPALAAIHRAGFGAHARVLDGARGNLAAQWQHGNLSVDVEQLGLEPNDILILINAPGRSAAAASTLARVGARDVWRLDRGTLTRHETASVGRAAIDDVALSGPLPESVAAAESARPVVPLSEDVEGRHPESVGNG